MSLQNQALHRFGLYIHWPYCSKICPYCDFNVYRQKTIDESAWANAFAEDLKYWRDLLAQHHGQSALASIYFGGGTPSLMPPRLIQKIIDQSTDYWQADQDIEITLEANPADHEMVLLPDFKQAGINRLSLGVQSFHDPYLKFLGRNHTGVQARKAVEKSLGIFDNMTFDMIYGLPEQSPDHWATSLREATDMGAPHLSLYQLTIEPDTAFANMVKRGVFTPIDDAQEEIMFDLASEICEEAGLIHYEVSNFAKPGMEAKHNSLYWQYTDYIGIGAGAHGRVSVPLHENTCADGRVSVPLHENTCAHGRVITKSGKIATTTPLKPAAYLSTPIHERFVQEILSIDDMASEFLFMGLRQKIGINLNQLQSVTGKTIAMPIINDLIAENMAYAIDDHQFKLTPSGRKLLNNIVLQLVDHLD